MLQGCLQPPELREMTRIETFTEENELVLLNKFRKLLQMKLYSSKSTAEKPDNIFRNQIDYILVNRRISNCFTSVIYSTASSSYDGKRK